MRHARLALAVAALAASSASAQSEPRAWSFPMTRGANHLLATHGAIGAGAASIFLLGYLTGGPSRNLFVGGAGAVGLLALFLGGGLTAGHLLEPTPPMAWSTVFAGAAGAAVGLGAIVLASPTGATFENVMLGMALGYLAGAVLDLALPNRSTMSWKEFWVPMVVSIVPGAVLFLVGTVGNAFRSREFVIGALVYPLAAFLVTRAIVAFADPFDPWVDDLVPPFRAEPILSVSPSGAMVGIAATW